MFDAKKLSEDQVLLIGQWAANGAQLTDIQKRLEDEMEFRLSYMDTRFLILDLGVEINLPGLHHHVPCCDPLQRQFRYHHVDNIHNSDFCRTSQCVTRGYCYQEKDGVFDTHQSWGISWVHILLQYSVLDNHF